jgi:hypothetical protein
LRDGPLTRRSLSLLLLGAAAVLVPWIGWLAVSLPCRYLSRHWGIAWAGFDAGLAIALGSTGFAALVRAPWLDRAAVAAATLLAADAWFDVLTSRGAAAVALAASEALGVELPLACVCIWAARTLTPPRLARGRATTTTATTTTTIQQGALS